MIGNRSLRSRLRAYKTRGNRILVPFAHRGNLITILDFSQDQLIPPIQAGG
jgi:hypothetical protein